MSEYDYDSDSDSNKKIKKEKTSHALEEFFGIEEGTTEHERVEYDSPLERVEQYDDKDHEIESEAHAIFKEAMTGYSSLEALLNNIEPKYRARMAEVALGYLKTALDASTSKRQQKESIEKLKLNKERLDKNNSGASNNIFAVGDRNEMLKMLRDLEDKERGVIDIKPEKDAGDGENS